jgi:predicted peptidase
MKCLDHFIGINVTSRSDFTLLEMSIDKTIIKFHLVFILLLVTFHASGQDFSIYEKRIFIGTSGDTLPYRILFPEGYDKSKKYPLVLFLHGGGERGRDNEKQLTHGAKLFLGDSSRKNYPGVVVFPQCPSNDYWGAVKIDRSTTPIGLDFDYKRPPSRALALTIDLVRRLTKEESIEPSRIYIMGLSMGGMGTFEAVYRNPKLFAAAIPICGGGDSVRYDKRIKKVPFWIFHGDKDAVVDVRQSRAMVNRLKKLKARVQYTEYPGVNHNSWDYAFAEPELLRWLFSNKR